MELVFVKKSILYLTGAAVAVLMVATGCSAPTETTATGTSTPLPAPSVARPSSPLSPDGFGANPPTREQLRELGAWWDGPGQGANAATTDAAEGVDRMTAAIDAQDSAGLRDACQNVTDPLTIRLPASLPTPDADMTGALQQLVKDAEVLKSACDEFGDPPTEGQLAAVAEGMDQLATDMETTGNILIRNGDLLNSAATGP
jgi:hypothetical protein